MIHQIFKLIPAILMLLAVAACSSGGGNSASNTTVTGVDTAQQISVVTAK